MQWHSAELPQKKKKKKNKKREEKKWGQDWKQRKQAGQTRPTRAPHKSNTPKPNPCICPIS